jgi:hypothetical protein
MNRFIRRAEKAFYISLVLLGAVFFLTAFLGSSMLNMTARLVLGSMVSICGLLELVPDLFKRCLQKFLLVIRLILIITSTIKSVAIRRIKSIYKKRKRRVSDETDLIKTSRIQRH